MTIREATQRLLSSYRKGVQTDDSRLTQRHAYNILASLRGKLLTQEAKQRQKVNNWNYQVLPCVELIEAPSHECPCLPPIGCTLLKSKFKFPKPLTNLEKHLIKSVTSIEGSIIYNETTWAEKKYQSGNKYTAKISDYWFRNEYLYTSHYTGPKVVTVEFLAQDPVEAFGYPSFCGVAADDCITPLDYEFPFDNDSMDVLIELAIKELSLLFLQQSQDLRNDSKDETPTEKG